MSPRTARHRHRSPFVRGLAVARVAAVLVVGVAPGLAACRTPQSTGSGPAMQGTLDPGRVAPEFEADWDAVRRAQTQDPAGPEVAAAADRLLSREPPLNLRLAALQAKAEQALRAGDYPAAQRHAGTGLAEVAKARSAGGDLAGPEQALAQQLARVRALAEAQVGDPQQALQWLAALPVVPGPDHERLAATASARERAGDRVGAVLALAQWRAVARDDSPEAALAEARMRVLWQGVDAGVLEVAARGAPNTAAAACLLTRAGHTPDPQAPPWARACGPGEAQVGFLLPRSGKFAGLADVQLAAAAAAVLVLARGKPMEVQWQDAGSTPAEVATATAKLVRAGVDVVVGPVGPGNVEAAVSAAAAAGGKPSFVVPGESSTAAAGVAPTIEARSAALVAQLKRLGRGSAVVLAPDNNYGKRAAEALAKSLRESGSKLLKTLYYPDDMTSFAKFVAPALTELRGDAALIVPDRLARMELLLKQMARSGMSIERAGGGKGVAVLSTGEGLSADAIGAGHDILEGVWLAPVAWPTPDAAAFADAYTSLEGQPPGDQAWLVWRAVSAAWSGGVTTPPVAAVLRVEGGHLVPAPAQVDLRPRETP
ncbi:MAG: penicillin-binding protein activator [Nannocystis sp.]|nr:penicillin-binding protein activator [Nannocystis sp.]MBK9754842.1 penicillin-binding protein activator [Nannocystis sp.]